MSKIDDHSDSKPPSAVFTWFVMLYIPALFLLVAALLGGCGQPGEKDPEPPVDGKDGQSCVVSDTGTITCGTTSYTVPRPEDGQKGNDGLVGAAGDSCVVSSTGLVTCGDTAYQIPAPEKGDVGPQGERGYTGEVGPAGPQGFPGTPGSVISAVVPCPSLAGAFPEVLLCIGGDLYAVLVGNGKQIRYSKVPPGTYETTDNRQCVFTVLEKCSIL